MSCKRGGQLVSGGAKQPKVAQISDEAIRTHGTKPPETGDISCDEVHTIVRVVQ